MTTKLIKFKNKNIMEEVTGFVKSAEKDKGEVVVCSGENFKQWRVNGKSIMGLYSLDLSKQLQIEIEDEDSEKLLKRIGKYVDIE